MSSSRLKGASGATDLPLDTGSAWDAGEARARVDDWANGDMDKYAQAFFYVNGDKSLKSSYKLPFADVKDGKLTAIWRGVVAAAAAIQGSRGGVDIPDGDVDAVKARIKKYYTKAGEAVPWGKAGPRPQSRKEGRRHSAETLSSVQAARDELAQALALDDDDQDGSGSAPDE